MHARGVHNNLILPTYRKNNFNFENAHFLVKVINCSMYIHIMRMLISYFKLYAINKNMWVKSFRDNMILIECTCKYILGLRLFTGTNFSGFRK